MAAENKDIEKDIDIEEVKEDNTADEAVEEEKAAEDAKDKKDEASKEAAPKKEKKFGKKKDKAVEKLEEKVKELEDMRVRQLAEFENFRKRSEKEKSQMFEVGAKSVIEKILPVIDNFERGFFHGMKFLLSLPPYAVLLSLSPLKYWFLHFSVSLEMYLFLHSYHS